MIIGGENGATATRRLPGGANDTVDATGLLHRASEMVFASMTVRVALTADFVTFRPVLEEADLSNPSEIGLQELSRGSN
jgi:hypothetical protein